LIRQLIDQGKMRPEKRPRKNMAGVIGDQIVYCIVEPSK